MSTSPVNSSQKTTITQSEFDELQTLLYPESHINYRTSLLVEKFFNSLKIIVLPTTTPKIIQVDEISISPKELTDLKESITKKIEEGKSWGSIRHALSRIWNSIFYPESVSSAQRLETKAASLTQLIENQTRKWENIKKNPELEQSIETFSKTLANAVDAAASTSLKGGVFSTALKDHLKDLGLPFPDTSKAILTKLYLSLKEYAKDAAKHPIQPIYKQALNQDTPFGFQKILEELETEKYGKYSSQDHRELLEVCRQIDIFLHHRQSMESKKHRDASRSKSTTL